MSSTQPTAVSRRRGRPSKKRKRAQEDEGRRDVPKALRSEQINDNGIRAYLDSMATTSAFKVDILPLPRKQQAVKDAVIASDLYQPRLITRYAVRPRNAWEGMRKFKKFTVGDAAHNTAVSLGAGDHILVKYDDSTETAMLDTTVQWKARVLEIRAVDPEHVFILVSWLNRPEDLDTGRKEYHGKMELIPTNQLDVIDAMCVNGSFELVEWDEDSDHLPLADQYFWRQTYDASYTKTFSQLKPICKCDKPHNPDEMIVQCPQGDCGQWMHVKCIAEDVVHRESDGLRHQDLNHNSRVKRAPAMHMNLDPSSSAVAKATYDDIVAEVYLKDAPSPKDKSVLVNGETSLPSVLPKPSEQSFVRIYTQFYAPKEEPVTCLLCKKDML